MRPKKCKKCGGMYQIGGMPRQQDYPDYESWQAAVDQFISGQQETSAPSSTLFRPTPRPTNEQPASNFPYQNIGIGMRAIRTGLGEISGRIERGRQNQYDYRQQTALGQMNPIPYEDFQPNPYNLYMKMGGNLKTILKEHQKFSNNANFDFGSGDDDKGMMNIGGYYGNATLPKGYHIMPDGTLMRDSEMDNSYMKKGGYEIDRMLIVRKLLPELLKFGRLGSGKYRNYKKGGYQTGGPTDEYYAANATLSFYKDKLNEQLKSKNPQAFSDYFNELVSLRRSGKQEEAQRYVQEAPYQEYLTPEEVRTSLGDTDYERYLRSLQTVNRYNTQQGMQPLYGDIEGRDNIRNLNYGRRFASLQIVPTYGISNKGTGSSYNRSYTFNPESQQVDIQEIGDVSLRPQTFRPTPTITFQYGGAPKYRGNYKKGGKWIQKATKSIKARGTEGVCTGEKFGSESCPPGSRRYNLARTFKKMARNR